MWALDLEHPTMVEASSTPLNDETTPLAAMYHYKFPARGERPPVDLFWYDGGFDARRDLTAWSPIEICRETADR